MQSDAYEEFLNGNIERSYPFVEDSSLLDDSQAYEFPKAALLDFRGFSRQEPEDPSVAIQLEGLVGPNAPSDPGVMEVDPSGWTLVFRLGTKKQADGTSQYFRVVVTGLEEHLEVVVPSDFATDYVGSVPDGGYQAPTLQTYTHLAASVQLSISPVFLDLMPVDDTSRLTFSTAFIEPALFPRTWKNEIERLVIDDEVEADQDVDGQVILRGGYNFEVNALGNSIQLVPERGAGLGLQSISEYREWVGALPDDSSSSSSELDLRADCKGNLLRINGIGPTDSHEFKISGENGVTVRNYPNQHLIVLDVAIPQPTTVCPDPEVIDPGMSSSSESSSFSEF